VPLLASCGSGEDGSEEPNVTLTFCAGEVPTWLAYQEGRYPWIPVTPAGGATYEFLLHEDAGQVAYMTASGNGLIIDQGSITELNTIRCPTGSSEVSGSVLDVPTGDRAEISLGWSYAMTPPGPANGFVMHDVADAANQDLIAVRGNADDQHYLANRLILRRGAAVPLGGTLPELDFASAESVVPDYPTVTIGSPAGLTLLDLGSFYFGNRQSTLALLSYDAPPQGAEHTFAAIPPSLLGANDVHFLQSTGYDLAGERMAGLFFRNSQNRTLPFGPVLNEPTVTRPGGLPAVELVSQLEYSRLVSATFFGFNNYVLMSVTAAYYGGTPGTWDILVPDLTDVEGFNFHWATDRDFDWEVTAMGGANPSFDQAISDGAIARSASRTGTTPLYLSTEPPGARLPRWGFPGQPPRLH
jgi:hypothetical protein